MERTALDGGQPPRRSAWRLLWGKLLNGAPISQVMGCRDPRVPLEALEATWCSI